MAVVHVDGRIYRCDLELQDKLDDGNIYEITNIEILEEYIQ